MHSDEKRQERIAKSAEEIAKRLGDVAAGLEHVHVSLEQLRIQAAKTIELLERKLATPDADGR